MLQVKASFIHAKLLNFHNFSILFKMGVMIKYMLYLMIKYIKVETKHKGGHIL